MELVTKDRRGRPVDEVGGLFLSKKDAGSAIQYTTVSRIPLSFSGKNEEQTAFATESRVFGSSDCPKCDKYAVPGEMPRFIRRGPTVPFRSARRRVSLEGPRGIGGTEPPFHPREALPIIFLMDYGEDFAAAE